MNRAQSDSQRAARASEAGFTLIELITYMAMMSALLLIVVGADQLARDLMHRDGERIERLETNFRLFRAVARDVDRATSCKTAEGRLEFGGEASYVFDQEQGVVKRARSAIAHGVESFETRFHPEHRLLEVNLRFQQVGEAEARTFSQVFHVLNHEDGGTGERRF
ncbi:MAG: PulJ/GspJ family protein [Planctomycetota bacterium]|jgi:type II secretory pathway component PulJ